MRKAEQNSTVQQLKSNLMGLAWGNYLISVCWKRITLKEYRSRGAGQTWIKNWPGKQSRLVPVGFPGQDIIIILK